MIKIKIDKEIDINISVTMEKTNDIVGTLDGFKEFHGEKVNDFIEEYLLSLKRVDNLEEKEEVIEEKEEVIEEKEEVIEEKEEVIEEKEEVIEKKEEVIEEKEEVIEKKEEVKVDIGSKCIVRCWYENGYSRRCTSNHKDGRFCKKHIKEYKIGYLNFGLMNEKRPTKYIGVGAPSVKKKKGKNIPWKNKEDDSELIYYPGISSLDNVGNDKTNTSKKEKVEVKEEKVEVKEEKVKVKEEKVKVKEEKVVKIKKKGCKKCGLCGEIGHNKRTCTKNKQVTQKEVPKKVVVNIKEEVEEKEICQDCKEEICDCKTIPLDLIEKKEQEELLSDEENEYIPYQGVSYYYDRDTNILSNTDDYGEVGKWNTENQCIDWNREEYKEIHIQNPDYSP